MIGCYADWHKAAPKQKWSSHSTCLLWVRGSSKACRCERDNGHHQQCPCRERSNVSFQLERKSGWILVGPSQEHLLFLNRRETGWCSLLSMKDCKPLASSSPPHRECQQHHHHWIRRKVLGLLLLMFAYFPVVIKNQELWKMAWLTPGNNVCRLGPSVITTHQFWKTQPSCHKSASYLETLFRHSPVFQYKHFSCAWSFCWESAC